MVTTNGTTQNNAEQEPRIIKCVEQQKAGTDPNSKAIQEAE